MGVSTRYVLSAAAAAYETMFRKLSRAQVASQFEALLAKLRWDGLRQACLHAQGLLSGLNSGLQVRHADCCICGCAALPISGLVPDSVKQLWWRFISGCRHCLLVAGCECSIWPM